MGRVEPVVAARLSLLHKGARQSAAAWLLLLDSAVFAGHLEKTLGRVPRKKPRPNKKHGGC